MGRRVAPVELPRARGDPGDALVVHEHDEAGGLDDETRACYGGAVRGR